MTPTQLQQWLVAHGQSVAIDGKPGPATRAAIVAAFTNANAPAVRSIDVSNLAVRLGCSMRQLQAVADVESGGAGFDKAGRPKILFERHRFHKLTAGAHSVCAFSNPKGGGYDESSWGKLTAAACIDADAAFASASWGKFQVMGEHWHRLGYPSPIDMAYSSVGGEAAHYEMLARYVEANGLQDELRALSSDPDDCRAFAQAYNGPAYVRFDYHHKLAEEL